MPGCCSPCMRLQRSITPKQIGRWVFYGIVGSTSEAILTPEESTAGTTTPVHCTFSPAWFCDLAAGTAFGEQVGLLFGFSCSPFCLMRKALQLEMISLQWSLQHVWHVWNSKGIENMPRTLVLDLPVVDLLNHTHVLQGGAIQYSPCFANFRTWTVECFFFNTQASEKQVCASHLF